MSDNTNKNNDIWLFVVALIALIFILLFYILEFGGSSFSNDPQRWGQFADYVGGLMNPLLSIIVLWTLLKTLRLNSEAVAHASNAVNEAKMSREAEDLRIKRQNTFDLNLSFQSSSMVESRLIASEFIKKDEKDSDRTSYNLQILREENNYRHFGAILTFFKQLNSLKNSDLIDEKLARELFGSYYLHFKPYFEKIINETETGIDGLRKGVEGLNKWMPKDYTEFLNSPKVERNKRSN